MSQQQGGSIIGQLIGLLLSLLKSFSSPPAQPGEPASPAEPTAPAQPMPSQPPADAGALEPLAPRVLLVIYNPIVDAATSAKLIQTVGFRDPDQLVAGYIQDLDECSGGLIKYQIVERVEDTGFAAKDNGYLFEGAAFVSAYRNRGQLDGNMVDYYAILEKYNVTQRVANNEIDELWLVGYPSAGFYESVMGGRGAFWCNGPELTKTNATPRRFVVMGFNYERGVGEMLESFGHRGESIMEAVYRAKQGDANLWQRFIRYEQTHPGDANCGNVHFAPNSAQDYDWGNATPAQSCADDWLAFPNLPEPPIYKMMTANDWGKGDIRAHHRWWLTHLPKVEGATDAIAHNWWKYIVDPNNARLERVRGMVAEPEHKMITHPWNIPGFK